MTSREDRRAYLKSVLESVYRGESEPFAAAISPDYVCHTPGRSQIAGDFRGEEHLTLHRTQIRALTGGTFRVRPLADILINEEWALVPVRVTAEKDGRTLDTTAFGIWRFSDGRIVEHWEMNCDQYAFDEFFGAGDIGGTPR